MEICIALNEKEQFAGGNKYYTTCIILSVSEVFCKHLHTVNTISSICVMSQLIKMKVL